MTGKPIEAETCKGWFATSLVNDERFTPKSQEEIDNSEELIKAFEHRVNTLIQKSGMTLGNLIKGKKIHPLNAWNNLQPYFLNSLGKAFSEMVTVKAFLKEGVNECQHEGTKEALLRAVSYTHLTLPTICSV